MTDSDAPAPLALTVLPGPDRSVPQQTIDLAVLAIRRGADRVSLLQEGMTFDGFHAPIGWLLRARKAADPYKPGDADTLFVDHQIGCGLDDVVAPAWLAAITEDSPVIEELIELFQLGAANGWEMTYERKALDHAIFKRVSKEYGIPIRGLRHSLEASACNWGFDAAAAARGDRVSTNLTLSICEGEPRDIVAFSDDGGEHRQVDHAHIDTLIRQQAPNSVPVAYFDEDLDGWVR